MDSRNDNHKQSRKKKASKVRPERQKARFDIDLSDGNEYLTDWVLFSEAHGAPARSTAGTNSPAHRRSN
jgi:hypothetical protein|tara:strand:- start:223 stop:429 length:207 start_codon:yes stop_codon:yes gene_type:complete